jgi:hypothetical protein
MAILRTLMPDEMNGGYADVVETIWIDKNLSDRPDAWDMGVERSAIIS